MRRGEEWRGEQGREGVRRWTGKAAFNLAAAGSSQLSGGDSVCMFVAPHVGVCARFVSACL